MFESLSSADLRVLCLVNKDLHILVEPFLYSKIEWTWLKAQTPPPIILLLRSILCRPQLAAYIRSVILNGHTFYLPYFRGIAPKISISEVELDEPIAFIQRTRVPYGDLWAQELRHGTMDAFIALLLSQLSNLTCLYLGPNFTKESQLMGMVLRSALCEPVDYGLPNFQHLRDVSFNFEFDNCRDSRIKNTTDTLPFFYLPTVQRISASIDNPATFTWPASHPPDPSRLTSLDLTSIREAYLGQLLSVTRALETLRWTWYYCEDIEDRDQFCTPIIDLDQVVAAISHVRGTLTDLTISADSDLVGGFYPPFKTKGSLNAIVNFDMLKIFEAPLTFLMGFSPDTAKRLEDVIPKNIEFLAITDDLMQHDDYEWEDYNILPVIQSFLENCKISTPHLRGISLLLRLTQYEWGPNMRNELEEQCVQVGIQLQIKLRDDL